MKKISIIAVYFTLITSPMFVFGIDVIEQNTNAPIENSFIVGPAKIEAEIPAGTSKEINVTVENRTGRTQIFRISFEDFTASSDTEETVTLLGDEVSQMSLKDSFYVEESSFRLNHGEIANIPVTISIPVGSRSGGRFGAVIFSAFSDGEIVGNDSRTFTGAVVLGRVASLVFVKIPGDVTESGELQDYSIVKNNVFDTKEITSRIRFENTGNVSLNPYGLITISNQFGKIVSEIEVRPWYVLPGSVRTLDVVLGNFPSGMYEATLRLNRGYANNIDVKPTTFFVLNPMIIVVFGFFLVCVVLIVRRVLRNKKNA